MNKSLEADVELKKPPKDSRILIKELEKELQQKYNDDTIEVLEIERLGPGSFHYNLEISSMKVELERGKVRDIIHNKLNELYGPKVNVSSSLNVNDVEEIK